VLVLAVDTATSRITAGVVALSRPHELIEALTAGAAAEPVTVLAERTADDAFAHAELLMPLVSAALAGAGFGIAEVDAIVVGLGPGPFTGLRVGIVTATALGDALNRPVYGVPSHDAVAATLPTAETADGEVLVVSDARRREVYVSGYRNGTRVHGPDVCKPAELQRRLEDSTARRRETGAWRSAADQTVQTDAVGVAGAGSTLVADLGLPALAAERPLSAGLVMVAAAQLLTGAVPGPLTPLYLRRPDAVPPKPRPVLR
jgi:tRNA threonylcarbamoyl adenosine modification protein YeaZ